MTASKLSIQVSIMCQVESQDFRISSVAGTYHDVACRETLDESMTSEKTRSPSAIARSLKKCRAAKELPYSGVHKGVR